MKNRLLPLLMSLFLLEAARAATLDEIQATADTQVASIEQAFAIGLSRVNDQYAATLRVNLDKAKKAGDLEQTTVIDGEIQRFNNELTVVVDKKATAAVQAIQTKFINLRGEMIRKRGADLLAVFKTAEGGLESLEKAVSAQPDALETVKARRADLRARAARFGLRLDPAAPAVPAGPPPVVGPAPGENWTSPATGIQFIWVPAVKAWVGRTEVSNAQYRRWQPDHQSRGPSGVELNGDDQPAVSLTYDNAFDYAEWLTRTERGARNLPRDYRVRLPTEDEWVACARAGDGRPFPWGKKWPPTQGNYAKVIGPKFLGFGKKVVYDDGVEATCPVDQAGENPLGLIGLGGNVWEACGKFTLGRAFSGWRGASFAEGKRESLGIDVRNVVSGDILDATYGFRVVLSK